MVAAVGAVVVDRRLREQAVVRGVTHVPPARDLFGRRIPAHRRYVLVYPDGRVAVDRTDADLALPDAARDGRRPDRDAAA
jgi:hypothetical protein